MSELPEGLEGTGEFLTEEEIEHAQELANKAARTPVVLLFGTQDLSADAWTRAKRYVHECALDHGLPEIQGWYGLSEDGEVVRMVDDAS